MPLQRFWLDFLTFENSTTPGFSQNESNFAAGVVFSVIFLTSASIQCFQSVRTRDWYLLPLILGSLAEAIGYAGQSWSSISKHSTIAPAVRTIFLLSAPSLYAASINTILGRFIEATERQRSFGSLTAFFVVGNLVCLVAQVFGEAVIMANGDDFEMTRGGQAMVLAGLTNQMLLLGFSLIAIEWWKREMKNAEMFEGAYLSTPWQKHYKVLRIACLLIFIRSTLCFAKFAEGIWGSHVNHGVWVYVFGVVLMAVVSISYNIVHPNELTSMLEKYRQDFSAGAFKGV